MKRIVSVAVMAMVMGPAFAAVPSHISRDGRGGYDVTYSYKDKPKSGWYAAARAEISLLNWTNKYSSDRADVNSAFKDDDFSMEPVFGGSLSFGRRINYFWRAELEAGFIGRFSDSDGAADFKMSIPYAMLNGYYDFSNGLYLGAGVGVAMPITTISLYDPVNNIISDSDSNDHTGFGVMGGLMAGFTHKLDDNLVLDLRYRLAGLTGSKHKVDLTDGSYVQSKTNFILDNSISIGLRYEF